MTREGWMYFGVLVTLGLLGFALKVLVELGAMVIAAAM